MSLVIILKSELDKVSAQRPAWYVQGIYHASAKIDGNQIYLEEQAYSELVAKLKNQPPAQPPPKTIPLGHGPGTELEKLIHKFGLKAVAGCKCRAHARQMNEWGPQKCAENIDTIVGWLREEAQKAKLPFVRIVATKLVKMAIKVAEREVSSKAPRTHKTNIV